MTYSAFFQSANRHPPYDWQVRLAGAGACQSRLIDIPTGLGKTAGVVLAWLWNRLGQPDRDARHQWPRRLVYCLPMRTLVEQTEAEVRGWVEALAREHHIPDGKKPRIVVLMGGEHPEARDKDWDLYPEEEAILIGTQDMLLSRALNRGYGMSRYRWPMHFALLNNDCLWVMDEVQLMGPGLAATTQMEGFRNVAKELGSEGCHSWWMSATIRPEWLKTVDMPDELLTTEPLQLLDTEKLDNGRVEALRTATKALENSAVSSGAKFLKAVAKVVFEKRSQEGLNLVVVNTVKRARELHAELRKLLTKETADLLLLHSQFRPNDRQRVLDAIRHCPDGTIIISTQVIEAGVDLSAHTLFTELAPWSSLVQRFGRCNRWLVNGQHHYSDARIHWFDLPEEKDHPPYRSEALKEARDRLLSLADAAIHSLETVESPGADRPDFRNVIRRKDLIDLFDTTPDLAGADLDIDRFIRDAEDSHVQVFWRNWSGKHPNDDNQEAPPKRFELCTVSIGEFKAFIKKHNLAYRWDGLDAQWAQAKDNDVYPGQVYLLHANQGGYEQGSQTTLPTGWTGNPKSTVHPVLDHQPVNVDSYSSDPASALDAWQTIAQHTDSVCAALATILVSLRRHLSDSEQTALGHAARWHDWGKAHPAFQAKLHPGALAEAHLGAPAAKAPQAAWIRGRIPRKPSEGDLRRHHFRHELASALGVLLPDSGFPETDGHVRDLAAYLIAAHHGKVRLSIRSMPNEWMPPSDEPRRARRFARGIWDGDSLPSARLGGSVTASSVTLSLEPMELGLGERVPFVDQPSWAERCLTLRDTLGPFKLALLETLIRVADGRASAITAQGGESIPLCVAETPADYGTSSKLTDAGRAMAEAIAAEGLAIQDRFRPEPLYKTTGKGHYESRTVEDIQSAKKHSEDRN